MAEVLKTTVRQLFKNKYFTTVSKLRINENGYPFITFLDGKKANNVYFGKNTADIVMGTFQKGDDLIANGFLLDAEVIQTQNENLETRYKLSKSVGDYSSSASLEEAFGGVADTEFNFAGFKAEFSAPVKIEAPTSVNA